jgi:GT2 family glycosyltransferase
MSGESVVAVTVTYGSRAESCIRTVRAAIANGAERVIVVDNGSAPDATSRMRVAFEPLGDALRVIRFDTNRGTAVAFAAGLECGMASGADLIWLLDDDNVAEPGCLDAALLCRGRTQARLGVQSVAVACIRESEEAHRALREGVPLGVVFEPGGSFFGVDVLSRLFPYRDATVAPTDRDLVLVPESSYGGLLLDRTAVQRVGLPREDFVLYFDDVEYSRRLAGLSVPIAVALDARIEDVVPKWADNGSQSYIDAMIRSRAAAKTYYSYRNAYVVDRERAGDSRALLRFYGNLAAYSAYCLASSIRRRELGFFRLYLRAVSDAARRRMGVRMPLSV